MSFQYKIYGLRINSSREISLLTGQPCDNVDLEVFWTTDAQSTPDSEIVWIRILTEELRKRIGIYVWQGETPSGTYTKMRYDTKNAQMDFLLDPTGTRLWILYDKNEIESDLDSYFVGPVLGCMLRLRGTICLHASAVEIEGKAVVFAGQKRNGKSTTAAAFSELGYKILADDVAVVTSDDAGFRVHSGYPKIRLRPDPLAAIMKDHQAESFPMVYSSRPTRYISLEDNDGFSAQSLPLGAIYILGKTDESGMIPFLKTLNAQEKIIKLIANTFGSYVVTADLRKKEFAFLSELAKKVPVSELRYGHHLETLSLQCETVIEDVRRRRLAGK